MAAAPAPAGAPRPAGPHRTSAQAVHPCQPLPAPCSGPPVDCWRELHPAQALPLPPRQCQALSSCSDSPRPAPPRPIPAPLRFAMPQLYLPGGHPVDLVLAVGSGEMASGLLGTTSLTYQLVGRPVAVVKELAQAQPDLQVMVSLRLVLHASPGKSVPRLACKSW
jgi:hypothetical protein